MYTIADLKAALADANDENSGGEEIDYFREISHYLIEDLIAAYDLVHGTGANHVNV